jgi:hypothetical protein
MQNTSKQHFIEKFETAGPEEFYLILFRYAQARISENTINKGPSPEVELLNYSNQFMQIYRRENKESYKLISYAFRRAAHKAYRMMVKQKLIKRSNKFLNLVE